MLVPLDTDEAVAAARQLVDRRASNRSPCRFCGPSATPVTSSKRRPPSADALPGIPVVSGAALQPTLREFERTAYAVLNAYTMAAV